MAIKRFQPQSPLPQQLQGYVFIDLEASGIHARSYPIEIGWATCDLLSTSFLIRPHPKWDENDWSVTSERIHNIPRQLLFADGIDVLDAAHRINAVCAGKEVLTDNPEFDQSWLTELFYAAGVQQAFTLNDANQISALAALLSGLDAGEAQALEERVKQHYPHPHRAAADARRAAAMFLALAVPYEIEQVIAAA